MRETLFNWLQLVVPGSRCLELYAGSGILSMEALSRGAAHVDLVEKSAVALGVVEASLRTLGEAESRFNLHCMTAAAFLDSYEGPAFDIVFLDPPFAEPEELISATARLASRHLLSPDSRIYVESAAPLTGQDLGPGFEILKHKRAGQVHYCLVAPAPLN